MQYLASQLTSGPWYRHSALPMPGRRARAIHTRNPATPYQRGMIHDEQHGRHAIHGSSSASL